VTGDPLQQLEAELTGTVWAMWAGVPPPKRTPGCPVTGWTHEQGPPWRVIAARDPFDLPIRKWARPYTGDEATVDVAEWLSRGR
jgi:hypothetical protein